MGCFRMLGRQHRLATLATNANLFLTGKDGPDPTWGRGGFTAKVFIAAAKRLNPPILETSGDS